MRGHEVFGRRPVGVHFVDVTIRGRRYAHYVTGNCPVGAVYWCPQRQDKHDHPAPSPVS